MNKRRQPSIRTDNLRTWLWLRQPRPIADGNPQIVLLRSPSRWVCLPYKNDTDTINLITPLHQDDAYKLHRLTSSPSHKVTLTRDDVLSYYYDMNVIREMEETAKDLYQQTDPNKKKYIRGFLHLYAGQVRSFVGALSHAPSCFLCEQPMIGSLCCWYGKGHYKRRRSHYRVSLPRVDLRARCFCA